MYLKRMEVKGFKSFADKIDLDFGKGITAIVGPNGSGKSNISDAIRWVLGEQSVKTLRGGKMEDVIFAGTENRKSLGCAEVTLTIDNASGLFPMDYAEINVTRRLFRSGESDYLINNTNCRLKDIVELFMDTGIGRDGYSLIGQGKIDEILSTRSEDRRNIFEEAAGIVKYKTRKLESEKKLENTKQNLIRINDIIQELDEQKNPLLEQSKIAKQYLALKEELKGLELAVVSRNYDNAKVKLEKVNFDLCELEKSSLQLSDKKSELQVNIQDTKAKITEVDLQLEGLNNNRFDLEKSLENKQGNLKLLNERHDNYMKDIERANNGIIEQTTDLKNSTIEIEEIAKEKDKTKCRIEEIHNHLEALEKEYEAITSNCSKFGDDIESKKSDNIQSIKDVSEINNKINSAKIIINNFQNRNEQLDKDSDLKKKHLYEIENDLSNIKTEDEEIIKNIETANSLSISLNNDIRANEAEELKLENEKNRLFKTLSSLEAKYNTLVEMEKDMEGFSRGVKSIMSHYKDNKTVFGTISDLITVPEGYALAYEITLGQAIQNIVVDNASTASSLIEYLKKNNLGRSTFLPLTTMKPRDAHIDSSIKSLNGFLGIASSIVKYDDKFKNVISNILGRVIICDNLENAKEIAKKTDYNFRIVTLQGDVINSGGSFTGGSINNKTSGIFTRKQEIEELNQKIKYHMDQMEIISAKLNKISSILSNNKNNLQENNNIIYELNIKHKTSETKVQALENEKKSIENTLKDIDVEKTHLGNELTKHKEYITVYSNNLNEIENNKTTIEQNILNLQMQYKDLQASKEKLQNELTQEKINYAELCKSMEALDNKYEQISLNKNNYINKINSYKDEIIIINNNISLVKSEIELNLAEIQKSAEAVIILKNKITEVDRSKKDLTIRESSFEKESLNNDEAITSLTQSIHKLELLKSKTESEIDYIIDKLWNDYELSILQAEKYRKEIDISAANKRINFLKNQIKELGDVNVNSIEEYKRIIERYDFLVKQKEDLFNAEKSLLNVIDELTAKMKVQFMDNFKLIKANFSQTFKKLFRGGFSDLRLEGDDVLNCGIEIIVQPPGKKLQNLSLLSGGEKGLSAIALIFAILKMKPTPFCVLDEIEAALDDANVNRFAEYLKSYSDNTQFIMITHRKGSMSVADALYGVTMEEKGVSKVVSLKLEN